jgi:hypothetical protein
LDQWKFLFSFSSGQTEKNSQKKLWKTKFVVWWFDVTKKLNIFFEYPSWNSNLEWTLPYTYLGQKSVNLQHITLGCLDDGTNELSTKSLKFQVIFFLYFL